MIEDVFTCCGQHTSAGGRFIQRARVQRGVWGVVHPGLHVQNGTGLKYRRHVDLKTSLRMLHEYVISTTITNCRVLTVYEIYNIHFLSALSLSK